MFSVDELLEQAEMTKTQVDEKLGLTRQGWPTKWPKGQPRYVVAYIEKCIRCIEYKRAYEELLKTGRIE